MSITEDASTPGGKTGTGTSSTITSNSFSPPVSALLVVLVTGEWSNRRTATVAITDSEGLVWDRMAIATGTANDGGVAAAYCTYLDFAPGSMTVTATFGNLAGGRVLDVRVLNGASDTQSALTGWSRVVTSSSTSSGQLSVTTTQAGSVVYGISDGPTQAGTFTALSGVTALQTHNNTVDNTVAASWKTSSATGTPGTSTLGGTWSTSNHGNTVAFEVLPAGAGPVGPPTMPTFVDGTVPHAADLNAIGANIQNLYNITSGGVRYQPYTPSGKGPIKPLCVLSVTNPAFVLPDTDAFGAPSYVEWDTVLANTDGNWSPLDPAFIEITTAGLWRLHFQVGIVGSVSNPDDQVVAQILVNGTTPSSNGVATAMAFGQAVGCSATLQLAEGTFLYAFASQYTGFDVNVGLMQFVAEWLGP